MYNFLNIFYLKFKYIYILNFNFLYFTVLSTRMKQLAILLNDFNFECIGTAQTDDENVICESLKRFGAIIGTIEDEREKMVR